MYKLYCVGRFFNCNYFYDMGWFIKIIVSVAFVNMILQLLYTICVLCKCDSTNCLNTLDVIYCKNIERHTTHNIVSWPNPKQLWVIVHSSDLMMIIRQSIYILSIITREMGKLKTHSPTYYIIDNWENMLNLTHTLDKIYLTGIL